MTTLHGSSVRQILKAALALLAGGLTPLSFAPYDLLIFSFIGLAIFSWLTLNENNNKKIFLNALFFGIGLFAVGVSWVYVSIHVYGEAAAPLAVFMTFLFVLFLALLFSLPWLIFKFVAATPPGRILGFASIWLLVEWIRGWIFTGFPWLYIGQAHLTSPLSGWLPIIGALGVGFIQAAFCAALVLVTQSLIRKEKISLTLIITASFSLLLTLIGPVLNRVHWTSPLEPVSVTLVQPNIPLQDKWNPDLREENLQILLDLSADSWDSDILVWPEAALPLATLGSASSDLLHQELESYLGTNSALVTGRLAFESNERRFYNNVIGLGAASGEYSKRRLVPFGEYVPLENQLRGLIEFFDLPMSVLSSGAANQEQLLAGDLKIAVALCYEIAYANQVAKDSQYANILVTVSNDTWFGDSIGPHQHFQIAQIRARETGKPVLRGTNNGITGVIDWRGKAGATSEQFVATSLTTEVIPYVGTTPFARWGHMPVIILTICSLIFLIRFRRDNQD